MHLFLDTTFGVTVGLLDENYEWMEYNYSLEKKSSTIIHHLINDILTRENLSFDSISSAFMVAGPGSYTGMRVSKGITDIFEWQNIEVYAFYQFEVPTLVGHNNGLWIADAFKGESFIYNFENDQSTKKLLNKDEAQSFVKHSDIPVFVCRNEDNENYIETQALIKDESKKLFKKVRDEKIKRKLFYYRELDQEFTKAQSL